MAIKKLGAQTVRLQNPPQIIGSASVVGPKEGDGPLGRTFDYIFSDPICGEASWEKAESLMQKEAFTRAMAKADVPQEAVEYVLAGDLLNQCIGTTFGLRSFARPFFGLYGACSTMAESLSLGAMLIDGGFADIVGALTSSHFCSAERQYRMPLEYGGQRPPTAQWTVTGSGACILKAPVTPSTGIPVITHVTTGVIVDGGIKDSNHMGAAMAPAAYETISAFFRDTGMTASQLDLIVTGDLGLYGRDIVSDLFQRDGAPLGDRFDDCGAMIFNRETQDVHAGGSGCGCSAVVLCGHLLDAIRRGQIQRILLAGTGALMSPISTMQGESIPSVCHAVLIERGV